MHSVEVEPLGESGLVSVRVTVWQTKHNEEQDDEGIRPGAFSLVRWMRDPFADETQTAGTGAPEQWSFP